jgi:hypothetical protein
VNLKELQAASREQDEQFARRHEKLTRWDQTCAVPGPGPGPDGGWGAKGPMVRTFDTGANRDVDHEKYDYEGFLDPDVIERFGAYMHKNRHLRDGSIRDSDNWQKGIPLPVYMKSLWRHFMDLWRAHRGKADLDIEEACCALMFNVMGYLSEVLKKKRAE